VSNAQFSNQNLYSIAIAVIFALRAMTIIAHGYQNALEGKI
jgi:hypothetical protein